MITLVDLPPVTRATTLSATNDIGMRAVPTSGGKYGRSGSMVGRRDARQIGAVSAPSVRMGTRARAAAVKSAPRKWATTRVLTEAERMIARIADRLPFGVTICGRWGFYGTTTYRDARGRFCKAPHGYHARSLTA